jgi:hypothetical protein
MKAGGDRSRAPMGPANLMLFFKRCLTLLFIASAAQIIAMISRVRSQVSVMVDEAGLSQPDDAPLVAIVCCTKSTKSRKVADFIERHLIPSIYRTITLEDRAKFRVELILGYDHDDEYWRQETNHHLLPKSDIGSVIFNDHTPIPIQFVSIKKDPYADRPNRIPFNELCQAAFNYGATYIVRVNDDTEFVTAGWITKAVNALASFTPPNVGVVGPTDLPLHQPFLAHDMVHAPTHYSIFDSYYPIELDNYFIDEWISYVYGKERTTQLIDWEVFHHHKVFCGARHCERYEPSFHQKTMLKQLVVEASDKVTRTLSKIRVTPEITTSH